MDVAGGWGLGTLGRPITPSASVKGYVIEVNCNQPCSTCSVQLHVVAACTCRAVGDTTTHDRTGFESSHPPRPLLMVTHTDIATPLSL